MGSVYLCPDGPTSRRWQVLSITRLKASLFLCFFLCCYFTKKFCGQNLGSKCVSYRRRRETICNGNILLHDSTHVCKYDVITASACLLCSWKLQVIEVNGPSVGVTVCSQVVGLLQNLFVLQTVVLCYAERNGGLFRYQTYCYINLYEVSGVTGGMSPSENMTAPHFAFFARIDVSFDCSRYCWAEERQCVITKTKVFHDYER